MKIIRTTIQILTNKNTIFSSAYFIFSQGFSFQSSVLNKCINDHAHMLIVQAISSISYKLTKIEGITSVQFYIFRGI